MAKRFTYEYEKDTFYDKGFFKDNGKTMFKDEVLNRLNNLYEENEELKRCERLANDRGEMIEFANALIQDEGSDAMKEIWEKFKDMKWEEWKEWRGLE